MPLYCFHSFPRPRRSESAEQVYAKAQKIVHSIAENGLLLVPEHFEMPVVWNGNEDDRISVAQCRICFTHIQPSDLLEHSKTFGPFSIVFDMEDLRSIGGLPVHYIPLPHGPLLYGLGAQILAGSADAARLVEALMRVRQQMEESPTLGMVQRSTKVGSEAEDGFRMNEEQTTVLRSFLDEFLRILRIDLRLTHEKMLAAASLLYPTEHQNKTTKLHYYQQHEWRISSLNLTCSDRPIAQSLSPEQISTVMEIDSEFFGKRIKMPTGSHRINEWELAVVSERCKFVRHIGDIEIVRLAKALVVPDDFEADVSFIEKFARLGVPVVKMSALQPHLSVVEARRMPWKSGSGPWSMRISPYA